MAHLAYPGGGSDRPEVSYVGGISLFLWTGGDGARASIRNDVAHGANSRLRHANSYGVSPGSALQFVLTNLVPYTRTPSLEGWYLVGIEFRLCPWGFGVFLVSAGYQRLPSRIIYGGVEPASAIGIVLASFRQTQLACDCSGGASCPPCVAAFGPMGRSL